MTETDLPPLAAAHIGEPAKPEHHRSWIPSAPMRLGLLAVLAIIAVIALGSDVFQGELHGPDAHSRLNRLEYNLETGDWSNANYPRSNAPFGEEIQWTRALDIPILVGAAPIALFTDWEDGLFVSGSLVGPLLHLAAVALMVWTGRSVLHDRRGLLWVGLLFAVQVRAIIPFLLGRPDHHGLILALYILHVGAIAWSWTDEDRRLRWVTVAGVAFAVSVWVSPEGLVTSLPGIAWLGGLWLLRGPEWASAFRRYALSAAAVILATWFVDAPPSGWFVLEYDRLSFAHVWLFALFAAFAAVVASAPVARKLTSAVSRAVAGGFGAVVCLVVLAVTIPDLFRGPMVAVPEPIFEMFLDDSAEWIPLFEDGFSLGAVIATFTLPAVALATYVVRFRQGDRLVVFLAMNHLLFIALSFQQIRWATYFGVLDVFALAWLLGQTLHAIRNSKIRVGTLGVSALAVIAAMLVGPLLLTFSPENSSTVGLADGDCTAAEAAEAVVDDPAGVVLASLFWGPELTYKTEHSVLGTPMHRNVDGILFSHDVMTQPPAIARGSLAERGVTHIAWCDGSEWAPAIQGHDDGLYAALLAQDYPSWLEVTPDDDTTLLVGRISEG